MSGRHGFQKDFEIAMQLSPDFVALLPTLRRYARALTGSQEAGDELVIKTLEWLGKSKNFAPQAYSKTAAYRILTHLWQGAIGKHIRESSLDRPVTSAADERISQLEGLPRQAFLLVAMEKFSPSEAAEILSLSDQEFSQQIGIARREIANLVATDVLIIEDERFVAAELEQLVLGLGHRVTGTVRTHKEAVAAVAAHQPGLILSDIQLADNSSGIDAVAEILRSVSLPIIFITGRPERLLTGQRSEPTFLIKKPFRADEVRAVISQAVYFRQNETAASIAGEAVRRTSAPALGAVP